MITVRRRRFFAFAAAASNWFCPIFWPSKMPPALAMPKHRIVPKLRTTTTKELAATASVPMWSMITEYMAKPTPQTTSLPSAGRESRIKSENSGLFRMNR